MKRSKRIAIIFGASLLSVTTTGCSNFPSLKHVELKQIDLDVKPLKSFVKGDKFDECADLEIKGYYSDGTIKTIDRSDVYLAYVNNQTGVEYNIYTPIPKQGEYTLKARFNKVVDETYTFSAVNEHVYVTSIELDDSLTELTVAPNKTLNVPLKIYPANYTERIFYSIENTSIASVSSDFNGSINVTGLKKGGTSLILSSFENAKHVLFDKGFRLTIGERYVNSISCDESVSCPAYGSTTLLLSGDPGLYHVDVSVTSTNNDIKVVQLPNLRGDDTTVLFNIRSEVVGAEGDLIFKAKKSDSEYTTCSCHVTVIYPCIASIKYDGPESMKPGEKAQLKLKPYPEQAIKYVYLSNNSSNIEVAKIDQNTYEITAKSEGQATITFESIERNHEIKQYSYQFGIGTFYANDFSIDGPTLINAGSSQILTLQMLPTMFNADSFATSLNEKVLTVKKINNCSYRVTGVAQGTAKISFDVQSSSNTTINKKYEISVSPVKASKTTIKATYKDIVNQEIYPLLPSSKNAKILVLPVWFSNSASLLRKNSNNNGVLDFGASLVRGNQILENLETAFFGEADEETGWYSAKSFIETESFGKASLSGSVSEWISIGITFEEYVTGSTSFYDIAKKASDEYFRVHTDESRKDYDSNKDGYIDAIAVVPCLPRYTDYQYGEEPGECFHKAWSYATSFGKTTEKNINKPGINRAISLVFTTLYENDYLKDIDSQKNLPITDTLIHEISHLYGVKDYYDDSEIANFTGGCTMQDGGNCGHDPFSIMAMGWANPIIPTKSCTLTFNDFQSSHDFVLLTPSWNKYNSPFDEYLMLELVTPTKLNYDELNWDMEGNVGIRLWHVNASLYDATNKKITIDPSKGGAFAFNNHYGTEGVFRSLKCDAYEINPVYQKFSVLSTICYDKNAGNFYQTGSGFNPISYLGERYFYGDTMFKEGDSFDMKTYRRQFVSYQIVEDAFLDVALKNYVGKPTYNVLKEQFKQVFDKNAQNGTATLDFEKNLGWTFEVLKIYNNKNNTYSVTVKFNKSK